ncbi:MAG: hypothetical protein KatS3mg103_0986 [Phycisphaerales bacterium]|nr:MAG: hypothetical protein KatS3mg103_0986 [Phycisphaerales bacterium]
MKTLARGKLCGRNPRQAPARQALSPATSHWPANTIARARNRPAMAATPAHSPSMLSRKFIALVMASSHRAVAATLSTQPPGKASRSVSRRVSASIGTASAGTAIRAIFSRGPSGRRSSTRPRACSQAMAATSAHAGAAAEAGSVHRRWGPSIAGASSRAARIADSRASTMPTPPTLGTGRGRALTCPGTPGLSRVPSRRPRRVASHVASRLTPNATAPRPSTSHGMGLL